MSPDSTSPSLTNPASVRDLLLYRLSRLLSTGGAPVTRLCEGNLGITRREWRVMASLGPGVTLLSSELAQRTQLDRARTSLCISSLINKGLISRQTVAGDGRKAALCLTEKGCAVYATFFPVVVQINAQLMQTLSAEQIAHLDTVLHLLQVQADQMPSDATLPKANRRQGRRR